MTNYCGGSEIRKPNPGFVHWQKPHRWTFYSSFLRTHSLPYTPLQLPPQDLFSIFTSIPTASQKHPLCPFLPLSSGDPRPFPCACLQPALFAAGNGRALWPIPSVTDVGFVTLTLLQAIPLPPSSSGIFSLHAIQFVTYKEGQGPAGCRTSPLSLGHLSFTFFLPLNKMLEHRKNKVKELAWERDWYRACLMGENFSLLFPPDKFSNVLLTGTDFQGGKCLCKLPRYSVPTGSSISSYEFSLLGWFVVWTHSN